MKNQAKKIVISSLVFLSFLNNNLFSQEYYPLQTGNKWTYTDTTWEWGMHYIDDSTWEWIPTNNHKDTSSVRVISYSQMPNGLYYYVLDNPDISGSRYVRIDSNWVHYFRDYDSADVPFLKLDANLHEQWRANFGLYDLISLEGIDTIKVFDITTRFLTYRLDGLVLSYVSFSDKLGPFSASYLGDPPGTTHTQITYGLCNF